METDGRRIRERDSFVVSNLEYDLPEALIAQRPATSRDSARMLVVDRPTGDIRDEQIAKLPELLQAGDLLVLNDTRVVPAKFTARRGTGGTVPGIFVHEEAPGRWRVMLRGSRRLRIGESLSIAGDHDQAVTIDLLEHRGGGHWYVAVDPVEPAERTLARVGQTPLPPYIHRGRDDMSLDDEDRSRYQTVYARRPGAIAAPTAGLHLTNDLLDRMRARGVETTFVTLHVGLGTFKPIDAPCLADHVMHSEWYELGADAADAVRACRQRGGRVVAVGTTSVRVLESAAVRSDNDRLVTAKTDTTDLFIYPPYEFHVVDALLTNFHLPRSTLLALVMAFAGTATAGRAYQHAIDREYRFYSYGDAMLIV